MGTGKRRFWKIGKDKVLGPKDYLIMGILNVTPDSFYDGGRYYSQDTAVSHGEKLIKEGADIIDIGGESTRPFSERVSLEDELMRVLPVIKRLRKKFPECVISIDTYKAKVAEEAIREGVLIVNDVSACRFDPELMDVLVEFKPGYVLMHSLGRPEDMQKSPQYDDVIEELLRFFDKHLNLLVRAGLPEENIVIDPGIGFGKLLEHNLIILREIEKFYVFGRPVLIGLSNKSMWEKMLGLKKDERQTATQVATALLLEKGVFVHRVHEVLLTRQTAAIVEAFKNKGV